jgi:MFS family permease
VLSDLVGRKPVMTAALVLNLVVTYPLLAVMLFGGFAQFFVTWLIEATGTPVAPAYYLMFGAAVGLLAALFLRERARDAQLLVTDGVEPTAA